MTNYLLLISSILLFNLNISANENDRYIEKQIANIDKLISQGKFVSGIIFLKNDTIETKLLTFKGKTKMNYNLFCVLKTESDSIRIFKANEILGYKIIDEYYISYKSEETVFFIKQIKTGKINLYEKNKIPSDNRFLYYMEFTNYKKFFVLNPNENNISEYQMPNKSQTSSYESSSTYMESRGNNEKFKNFISSYLRDCEKVVNMVKSEFYTINDIPSIIETYNSCFNK